MTNPFGEGGFDLGAMLEQAQQMQNQLLQAQDELAAQTVSGTAGGVSVTLSGVGEVTGVAVVPGTFDGSDPDSLADLGDLVVAAYRDAKAKVDALAAATLGPLSNLGGNLGGGGLPGLGG
ncbi:YbaB/EbfC family nucleoid-associated protein [Nocardioides marmorisolisilvae]|uniref:Nucleoid-associated protein EFL95_02920 n=1 Tax=Nocardioides marmorisolisilvae TaxID=1542737 RepID=A0A3N0E0F3_9ACTN|nr:YbaB/EbfC family nucleoid-associated protein [Nocardioides marmorisolisilvae]RNL81321.1 YbaB/EbfC family nucleoid-associated protein [Nocardioides marmorisolisilvae]